MHIIEEGLFSKLTLFFGVSLESVEHYLDDCEIKELSEDQVIIAPEKPNDKVYILLSGTLRVHLESLDNPAQFRLKVGECVGEMSIIDRENPVAYVVADEPVKLLVIEHKILWQMVHISHGVAANLLLILSSRLRMNTKIIADNLEIRRQIEEVAMVDALTGLQNRRWLDTMFPRLLARCSNDNQPLTVIMVDIDHFKDCNDRYGHLVGDRVLIATAKAMRERLRPSDMIARYGGEEFIVLLPGTTMQYGVIVAERLRQGVKKISVLDEKGELLDPVTISLGLAESTSDSTMNSLIETADRALYRAKSDGRDRIFY